MIVDNISNDPQEFALYPIQKYFSHWYFNVNMNMSPDLSCLTYSSTGISLVDGPKKPPTHPFAPREECINYEDYFMDKVQVSLPVCNKTSCCR